LLHFISIKYDGILIYKDLGVSNFRKLCHHENKKIY